MSDDKNEKRLAMLEAVIAKGSDDPFVHYARAMALRGLGRRDDALGAFDDVATRFPAYVPTYLMAGQVAAELERDDDARGWFERGLEKAEAAGDGHARGELEAALAELV
ncbi:MAG: tetratricopeptide repeat protein [Myxococcota bacterium]